MFPAPIVPDLAVLLQTLTLNGNGHHVVLTGWSAAAVYLGVIGAMVYFVVLFVRLARRARRARRQLGAAEAELRALFAGMQDVVFVLDRDGRYLRIPSTGARGEHRLGTELIGRSVDDVLPGAAADAIRNAIAQAMGNAQAANAEYSVQVDGETVWFSATVSRLDDRSVVCVARDITERRAAEEALSRSEERYRVLFERNPCAMWVFDHDTTRIMDVNATAIRQYGFSREEFIRMSLHDLRPPEEAARLTNMLDGLAPGDEGVHLARHRTADGRSIDVEVRGHPLGISERRLRLVVANDVTERLAAERMIREAEARAVATSHMLQTVIDAAPQAMVVVDTDLKVTRWNRAAEAMFGWTQDEVLGNEPPMISDENRGEVLELRLPPNDRAIERQFEAVRTRKDGRPVNVLVARAPFDDADGKRFGYIAAYADLTERKHLEEQLRQSQKMEAIGTLAGGVAHDFNNILTVISSYAGMLLSDDRYPDARSDLEEIAVAAKRATALTRQLLTFSRKAIVRLQPVDVNAIVSEMQPMLRRLLMANIDLVARLEATSAFVTADLSQIEQVVMNLVVNAVDAMPDGGSLVIETRNVELDELYAEAHAGVRPGAYVLLAVTDSGIGMDAATAQKIFEPFFTTKEVGRGTGLGLATVYAIVKNLSGHIWVYSEPGQGAAFKIYLPCEAAPVRAAEAPASRASTRAGTALLVEDDDAVRRVARRMLERAGFSVLEAPNGEAGLSVASSYAGEIHVVVTDIMMPGMNGGDFAQALAASHPQLRVVFMSGYTDDAVLRRGLVDAAHTFLQKPFTGEQLVQAISQLLDRPKLS